MLQQNITFEPTFQNHPILTGDDEIFGAHQEILFKLKERFDYMVKVCGKLIFIGLAFRFMDDYGGSRDNRTFKQFISSFTKHIRRGRALIQYVWIRGCSGDGSQHYNLALLADYREEIPPDSYFSIAEELWTRQLGLPLNTHGLVDYYLAKDASPKIDGIVIDRKSPDFHKVYDNSFQLASHLAKVDLKSYNAPPNVRHFGSSWMNYMG